MQPLPVTQTGFDGVAKGVAKVQNSAQARFALVLRHHVGFDLAAALDRMGQRHRVTGQQRIQVGRDPVQKAQVCYRAILDDLGQAGAEFALGQGAQYLQVAHHQLRLVEGAYHVFAQRVVDAGLATDRRIDLRQQRGGQLHKRHAAHETGRGKAGHVADHPATERKQHCLTVASLAQQGVKNQVQGLPGLVLLAIGQHHFLNLPVLALQRAAQTLQVEWGHRRIGDDQGLAGLWQVGVGLRLSNQAAANQDRVTALRQVDADKLGGCMLHGREFRAAGAAGAARASPAQGFWPGNTPSSSSCMMIMLTKVATDGRPVSITKCAVWRYSGSRAAYKSRRRVKGSATCSRGRLPSWRRRRNNSSGSDLR